MKKLLSVTLVLALLCALLTGCVYENMDMTIHADGSGSAKVVAGISAELFDELSEMEDSGEGAMAELSPEELETFEVDGKTYKGIQEELSFSGVEEFNALFGSDVSESTDALGMSGLGSQVIELAKDGNGLTLTVNTVPAADEELTDEAKEELQAARIEATKSVLAESALKLEGDALDSAAAALADWYDYYDDAEYTEMLMGLVTMSEEELHEELDWLIGTGTELTEEQLAEREEAAKKVLSESALKLEGDALDAAAGLIVSYTDVSDDEDFNETLDSYAGMTAEELQEELDWLDRLYNGLPEEEVASRIEDAKAFLSESALKLTGEKLDLTASAFVDWFSMLSAEEYAEQLEEYAGMSKAELEEELADLLSSIPPTEAELAARLEPTKKALAESALKLEGAELDAAAEAITDWYDFYSEADYAELLTNIGAMSEEELHEELDWLIGGSDDSGLDDLLNSMEEMTATLIFRFDTAATQIAGPSEGITIEGGTVTLDLTKMAQEVYRFTTRTEVALAYEHGQAVLLDGQDVELCCYALRDANNNETNYVFIRDIANLLNGTDAQFSVGWDGAVNLESGKAYEPNGNESVPFSGNRTYGSNAYPTLVNGVEQDIDTITLSDAEGGGYTFYKLRDLGEKLNFNVRWDNDARCICIESDQPYTG